ncbi:hypothetical protein TSUD_136850 [Trifolium subterraneum]|uniref:Uncharacterized protein n=1 Tax=Trifolium subterraneum TaxID=3900 RepID=A0A2Z6PCD9_TRISU|nr:hypothetical protein TSUD_136850 [Trifolium subterraneum]
MHIIRGRLLLLARFLFLITVQTLMSASWINTEGGGLYLLYFNIKMSTDIERKVGNLLNSSQSTGTAAPDLGHKQSVTTINLILYRREFFNECFEPYTYNI